MKTNIVECMQSELNVCLLLCVKSEILQTFTNYVQYNTIQLFLSTKAKIAFSVVSVQ